MVSPGGVVVLVGVALLQWTARASANCKGADGRPGEAGIAGREGWPGLKGDKGQPALSGTGPKTQTSQKGGKGRRGNPGLSGPKGYQGDLGEEGEVGSPGAMGPGGNRNPASSTVHQSAFSVVRTLNTYPLYNQKVIFQNAVVNTNEDFSMTRGMFTCRVPGVYYFVFHASSKVSMCLRLKSEVLTDTPLGFCDYNTRQNVQVLSGGVVLQLTQGQHVWMEGFQDQQPATALTNTEAKNIIFNGFLLFPTN